MSDNTGFFVLAYAPTNSFEFGIDCISYDTGPNFKGLSMIPPGIHFIYYSTGMGSRQGFFVEFSKSSLEVRAWDSGNEIIESNCTISEETMVTLRYLIQSGQLNSNLGPYPYSIHTSWCNLSSFINVAVLERSECQLNTTIYPGDDEDISKSIPINNMNSMRQLKPYFSNTAIIAKYCSYSSFESKLIESFNRIENIDERMKKLTNLNIDKSLILTDALTNYFGNHTSDILGEIQLSFILFMFLYSFPALEHWKYTINLICNCDTYLISNEDFTKSFLRVLYEQLNFIPNDFFEQEISRECFLAPSLSSLLNILSCINQKSEIYETKKRFFQFISNKFSLFSDENLPINNSFDKQSKKMNFIGEDKYSLIEEDLPVVVDETYLYFDNPYNHIENEEINQNNITNNIDSNKNDLKYCWRYPNLYEVMILANGKEDMIMTAVRLIDEYQDILNYKSDRPKDNLYKALESLVFEAKMFIEEECKS